MRKLLAALCLGITASLQAAEPVAVPPELKAQVEQLLEGRSADSIRPAPVPGLWEVAIGMNVVYFSADGRYLVRGDLIDIGKGENLTEAVVRGKRLEAIEAIDEKDMIVYAPKAPRHTITVFTDVDCGYCRKLHDGMAEMNRLGIAVRYLAFPRAGIGSPTYQKMEAVWCAKDQRKAMDAAKAGQEVTGSPACKSPLPAHMELVRAFGINGTPALVLEDGNILPGYLPPERLLATLEEAKKASQVAAASR